MQGSVWYIQATSITSLSVQKVEQTRTVGLAEVGIGNLALQRHAAGFKTPIIKDKLFFGINGLYQSRDGYWKNDTTGTGATDGRIVGKTVGGEKNLYGNVYLTWLPSAKFSATLNVKGQRDWSDNSGFFVSQPNETVAFKNPDKIYLRLWRCEFRRRGIYTNQT